MNSDKFRELERSLDSDPYNIYLDDNELTDPSLDDKSSKSNRSGSQSSRKVITDSSDMTVSKDSSHSAADIITDYLETDLSKNSPKLNQIVTLTALT
jgi:hypothetical protein